MTGVTCLLHSQNMPFSPKQFHGCILYHLQVDSQWLISLLCQSQKERPSLNTERMVKNSNQGRWSYSLSISRMMMVSKLPLPSEQTLYHLNRQAQISILSGWWKNLHYNSFTCNRYIFMEWSINCSQIGQ